LGERKEGEAEGDVIPILLKEIGARGSGRESERGKGTGVVRKKKRATQIFAHILG